MIIITFQTIIVAVIGFMLVALSSAVPAYGGYDDSGEYDDDSYGGVSYGYGGHRSYSGRVGYGSSSSYGGLSGGYGGYSVSSPVVYSTHKVVRPVYRPVVHTTHKVVRPVVHKKVVTGYSHGRGYGY